MNGTIFQINSSPGGVPKLARLEGLVTPDGLEGDAQRNTISHGGPMRALCLYSLERILALQAEGHPIFPGAAGENLTLSGLPWEAMTPGTRWRLGEEADIEITKYCTPCSHLTAFFLEGEFNRIHQEKRPGWSRVYARVLASGRIRTGAPIRFLGRPEA